MKIVIDYKGVMYSFTAPQNEPEYISYDRCWFIVKNYTKEDVRSLADVWIAHKYFESTFDENVMGLVEECLKNLSD